MASDYSKLTRQKNKMPDYIKESLENSRLMLDYLARPAYQQNDYIGWIERAKKKETKLSRLNQMLDELKLGGVYMKMKHPASQKI
jgi:uncharacterized protein YdeI (YjbR/CyaY-like superfamily)